VSDQVAKMSMFPKLQEAVSEGIRRRLHTGVQVFIQHDGQVVLDEGFGDAAVGRPMTRDTVMLWRSAGKPVTAAAIMRRIEQQALSLDETLDQFFPSLKNAPGEPLTIRRLLTHTVGPAVEQTGWPDQSWGQTVTDVLAQVRDSGSQSAAYQPQATWFLLGDILRQTDRDCRSFDAILKEELLVPLDLHASSCGIASGHPLYATDSFPTLFDRKGGQLVESPMSAGRWLSEPSPGGNLRGPVRDLGGFYAMMLNQGVGQSGHRIMSRESVEQMTERHRTGQFDSTLQHIVDFGLGVIIDSNHHGIDTVPYGFGRHCSPLTFGHGGSQCSMGFCDPDNGLVVAWAANGFCGEGHHQRRNRAINEAIYVDLGLA
jgi:CubicO group peptidase (beta-lactamase class C family)